MDTPFIMRTKDLRKNMAKFDKYWTNTIVVNISRLFSEGVHALEGKINWYPTTLTKLTGKFHNNIKENILTRKMSFCYIKRKAQGAFIRKGLYSVQSEPRTTHLTSASRNLFSVFKTALNFWVNFEISKSSPLFSEQVLLISLMPLFYCFFWKTLP